MTVWYNEIDPYAAQWLRNLIAEGHIAPGVVDERSIEDVRPIELAGYTQCHFFAGIGAWSLALRRAGWPDDRPVWTGSCPCQPFSTAGKGGGFDDERHLWPAWQWLIGERKPPVVLGEQVASKDAESWIDLVHADLEAMGYAFGCVPFPAAGVGAPHIRDRNYWVGALEHTADRGYVQRIVGNETSAERSAFGGREERNEGGRRNDASDAGSDDGMAAGVLGNSIMPGLSFQSRHGDNGDEPGRHGKESSRPTAEAGGNGGMAQPNCNRCSAGRSSTKAAGYRDTARATCGDDRYDTTGPTNGFWRDADWLFCRDGKWRPVEPGTFPLAHGSPARVGRLRAYGNCIVPQEAQAFIESYLECKATI